MKSLAGKVTWLIEGGKLADDGAFAREANLNPLLIANDLVNRGLIYAPIRINAQGLSFRSLACYRERREAEVREMEKAKLERERLEKQRAEQAVHKHFEESLRLAQQKVSHALLLVSTWRDAFFLISSGMLFMLNLSVFIGLLFFRFFFSD